MCQKNQPKTTTTNNKYPSNSLVSLGNSSNDQLKTEAKKWVKEARRESRIWGKALIS
jgi:hypothetical protein